jgi:aspartyl-tRNA(Asn)/glutamyl-tRNA(Gln) amidotransferase subunit A
MARYDGLEYGFRSNEMTSTEALFASVRHHGFNDVVRGRILAGNYFLLRENYDEYFKQALKVRRLITQDFANVFESVDLLLTPVTLTDAPTFKEFSGSDNRTQTAKNDYCTQPANLAGLPAATIPVKLSKRSLPLSLQVIGPHGRDMQVLGFCKWLENRIHFPQPELVSSSYNATSQATP